MCLTEYHFCMMFTKQRVQETHSNVFLTGEAQVSYPKAKYHGSKVKKNRITIVLRLKMNTVSGLLD